MLATLLCAVSTALSAPAATPAQVPVLEVLRPLERQVIQRDARDGADVEVSVRAATPAGPLHARVRPSAGGAEIVSAQLQPRVGEGPTSIFMATLRVPAGGWYRLSVTTNGIAGPVEVAHVERFAVGEVFVVAGQSNSTNSGEEPIPALDDRVSSFDGARWALAADPMPGVSDASTGGSPWVVFGKELAAATGVPVAISPVGYGGTSIQQWQKDVKLNERTVLFENLVKRVEAIGKVRAILWHQGESDAAGGTSQADYERRFRSLREDLRARTGCAGPWIVANASYVPDESKQAGMAAVRAAQQALWKDKSALQGPDTDDLLGDYRAKDRIHFSKKGLEEHGKRWALKVRAALGT